MQKKVQELIDLLSSDKITLNVALSKTQVLLHDLGEGQPKKWVNKQKWINLQKWIIDQKQTVKWINNELTGYSEDDDVPNYRLINLDVGRTFVGTSRGFNIRPTKLPSPRTNDEPLNTSLLDEEIKKKLPKTSFRKSIEFIEKCKEKSVERDSLLNIKTPIPPEVYSRLSTPFNNGNGLENVWSIPSIVEVLAIITQVKPKLLSFLLDLSKETPRENIIVRILGGLFALFFMAKKAHEIFNKE